MEKTTQSVKPFLSAHVPFDQEIWAEIARLSSKEDRTIVATIRVLVREALAARKSVTTKV
jgi:hypothetical protein